MSWSIGDAAETSKTISESDVYLFAGITGDFNPMHVNAVYANNTRFGGRIAHGMLVASHLCTVLGMTLPGPGTIHVEQSLRFLGPVAIGDTITARVEITEIFSVEQRSRMRLHTTIKNQDGDLVVDGDAIVKPPSTSRV